MNETEHHQHWRTTGKYYGYPQCCIDAFINDKSNRDQEIHKNQGFLPCQEHAKQIKEGKITIESLITNREHNEPFPFDGHNIIQHSCGEYCQDCADYEKHRKLEEKRINKLKQEYKRLLKDQIDITELYARLNDEVDFWEPVDIVEIEDVTFTMGAYALIDCVRIVNTDDDLIYLGADDSFIDDEDGYYLYQSCIGEDRYAGYFLFPLKNGQYFKVFYNC